MLESAPLAARLHARSHGAHVVGKLGLTFADLAADREGVGLDDAERDVLRVVGDVRDRTRARVLGRVDTCARDLGVGVQDLIAFSICRVNRSPVYAVLVNKLLVSTHAGQRHASAVAVKRDSA